MVRTEKEIKVLIRAMEQYLEEKQDALGCSWFCVDCLGEADELCHRDEHRLIHQCFEHSGVNEWIDCLKWVLGEK